MKNLQGKVAFVTGGSSGIGLGIVKVLAEAGMKVAFSYRRQDHRDEAMAYFAERPHDQVHPIKVDVTDRPGLAAAKLEIERIYGPVRVLVNNAGVGVQGPIDQASFGDWDWVLSVNLGGVINCVVTFLPDMIAGDEEGHIVNVSSIGGIAVLGSAGVYATSKFAVVGLSEALRTDLIGRRVGVSVYCPGTVKSNIGEGAAMRHERYKDTGYAPPPTPASGEADFMSVAMDAIEAGRHVLKGIEEDQLYIISHGEFRDVLRARHATIEAAITDEPVDAARAESVRFLLSNAIYGGDA
jgi:NAD(P)-dependent dehydrogenase (short-subunit alcohol dehydrogenase family)